MMRWPEEWPTNYSIAYCLDESSLSGLYMMIMTVFFTPINRATLVDFIEEKITHEKLSLEYQLLASKTPVKG
jgi:hypothetical protein